jgi:hypothetical protein
MDMHPVQVLALIVLALIVLPVAAAGAMAIVFAFFGVDVIPHKGESSRLIRWPKAIKQFLRSVYDDFSNIFYAITVFFNPVLAERVLREIATKQPELPLER